MKELFTVALFALSSFLCGQDTLIVTDVYTESLKAHIADFENYLPGIDTFYVFKKSYHTSYKGSLNGVYVLTISEDEAKSRTKKGKSFTSTVISPIQVDSNGELYILVKDFDVSRKGRKLHFAGTDATWCYLIYSCEKQKYHVVKK
ncbi:hypothetical protein FUA23_00590 [Neolewinella aurantiaca]|uniref:Uncharacterized protein n=1 Tax=Neolewinella aurantiaca TaxID=2602767 RepID=A0A5C7FYN2_9BACT|nr:hypothetical protein [Neolewinella aurantiaca]TXF91716.1 hypothetical protein FUA23_00590 [Neolewinella aurantiaca]